MSQQSVRQAARRSALDAQAVLRKERADRERRLEALAVEVLTALGERDAAGPGRGAARRASAADDDRRRGLVGAGSGRMVRQRRHSAGNHPAAPPGGPAVRAVALGERAARQCSGSGPPTGTGLDGASRWRRVSRIAESNPSSSNAEILQSGLRTTSPSQHWSASSSGCTQPALSLSVGLPPTQPARSQVVREQHDPCDFAPQIITDRPDAAAGRRTLADPQ